METRKGFYLYFLRKFIEAAFMVWMSITIIFVLIHLAPGDPMIFFLGQSRIPSQEFIDMLRLQFGLDKTLSEKYILYISNILRGNLGYSFVIYYGLSVVEIIFARFPATLILMLGSTIISSILGILIGVIGASKSGSKLDSILTMLSLISYSVPVFFSGIVFMLFFSLYLRILPVGGYSSISNFSPMEYAIDVLKHAISPIIVLGTVQIPLISRLSRAQMLEVFQSDYIIAAKAKGLSDWQVIYKHILKNSLPPVVTMIGLNISSVIMGTILTETVFNWPGLGTLIFDAVLTRDYPLVSGIFIFVSIFIVVINFVIDLIYAYIDPRVRFS